jgi:von Willebrand factor type A domain
MATSLVFLSPLGALLVLGVLVPLGAVFLVRRRARRVRETLGLVEPSLSRLVLTLATMVAAGTFLGVAAAQPVVEQTTTVRVRTDAEAYVVVDISRSMLARQGSGGQQRIDRAKRIARELRASLGDIRFGVVSLTDRVLPHLFPSADADVFEATLDRSLGIEQPPPRSSLATSATKLDALAAIRTLRFFSPLSRKRLLVVLTDGETQPVGGARLGALLQRPPAIETVFVHLWHPDERVYTGNVPEAQYRPDPSARALLDGIAKSIRGSVYAESDVTPATQKARELLGGGPTVVRGEEAGRVPLAPYLAAAALVPLAMLLRRLER